MISNAEEETAHDIHRKDHRGTSLFPTLKEIHRQRTIVDDNSHVLAKDYELLQSIWYTISRTEI